MFRRIFPRLNHYPMALVAIGFLSFLATVTAFASSMPKDRAVTSGQKDIIAADGKPYRLFIAQPDGAAPDKGWPLVVLLDGNMTFPLAQSLHPKALLVGIGYPTERKEEIVQRRFFDLTTKAPSDKIPTRPGAQTPQTGGEAAFKDLIINKILPDLKATYPIDDNRKTLFGHSLGGLFVMNTLISQDKYAFQTYCAADPSIWWNSHEFMARLERFQKPSDFSTRLLIETSGMRTDHKKIGDEQKKRIADLRSGPNGKDVSNYLKNKKHIDNSFHRFDDKNHGTMVAPSIKDCLAFTLENRQPINPPKQ